VNIYLFFTYGTSLSDWENTGLLNREIKLYENIAKKNDYKITFVTYGDEQDNKLIKTFSDLNCIPIYKYVKKSKFKIINYLKSFYIPFVIKKLVISADIIKTNQLNGSWVAIISKYLLNSKLIIRTGYDHFQFLTKQKKFFKAFLMYLLTSLSLNFTDIYTVTSKQDLQLIRKIYFFKKDKLLLRPNWVKIPEEINQTRHSDRVLMVGRLEKQKNYEYTINEFASHDITIDIVGSGSLKNQLTELSQRKATKVNFLGNMPHSELVNLYQQYDYYISSSLYEGNPKSTLEAIANGCIVICSNIPNNQEIIQNNINGFLYTPEENALRNTLNKLISENKDLSNFRKSSMRSIYDVYGFDEIFNKEIQDYLQLTNT
jgi:glycosyltransferase involved in cell wall biosynthesis